MWAIEPKRCRRPASRDLPPHSKGFALSTPPRKSGVKNGALAVPCFRALLAEACSMCEHGVGISQYQWCSWEHASANRRGSMEPRIPPPTSGVGYLDRPACRGQVPPFCPPPREWGWPARRSVQSKTNRSGNGKSRLTATLFPISPYFRFQPGRICRPGRKVRNSGPVWGPSGFWEG